MTLFSADLGKFALTGLVALFSLMTFRAWAQPIDGLIGYYSFDACDATEDTGSGADGVIMGNSTCGCGVSGNGLRFDGTTMVQILGNLDVVFEDDFTVSFFMLPEPAGNSVMSIISKSEVCGIDSTVEFRYNPANREASMTLSQSALNIVRSRHILPADRCYHHITYVRRDRDHYFYYDGVQQNISGSTALVSIRNNGILTLGGGPCLANGEVPFRGVLDELRIYNRALNSAEVAELYLPVDRITSPDTVIFTGTSMNVRLPVTCASSIQWTPSTGVTSPNQQEPSLAPVTNTTYFVEMDYGFCSAMDSIRITVADSSDLDCEKVFFPTGFTPNGDGLNDDWGISNVVFLGEFESLDVYDRWGGKVFASTDPGDRWDGTLEGEVVDPGQFVYQFIYNCGGQEYKETGAFVLIR